MKIFTWWTHDSEHLCSLWDNGWNVGASFHCGIQSAESSAIFEGLKHYIASNDPFEVSNGSWCFVLVWFLTQFHIKLLIPTRPARWTLLFRKFPPLCFISPTFLEFTRIFVYFSPHFLLLKEGQFYKRLFFEQIIK